ncbi:flagellar protein [Shewanella sp. NFH-SH190041]|uniref:flagellar biosynthetic protein FliO n=1 Tax=Shewanella sp. NFH-SH190041 TaxID=2950245 RepID=UPI0021C260E8|nr:flagellar biosynthetic protein FliO [Shewanella sp. NFH-SH190041]BDM63809.1 flagellar protein [Shewanella sp. NFH-SH190041]
MSIAMSSLAPSQAVAATPSNLGSVASMAGGLVLVLLLIFVLAYVVRRFNLVPASHGTLKTVAVASLGQKEKLVLVQVGEQQYLLGVTPNQVNLIDKLAEPVTVETASFADRLKQVRKQQP